MQTRQQTHHDVVMQNKVLKNTEIFHHKTGIFKSEAWCPVYMELHVDALADYFENLGWITETICWCLD